MIDVKEFKGLTIGNYVYQKGILPDGKSGEMVEVNTAIVVDIDILAEIVRGNKMGRYSSIPITAEILDKCFKKDKLSEVCWVYEEFTIYDEDGLWGVQLYFTFIRHIEFVHELQNVYYWIMQKELEVRL